jgi:hypothetical protein
MLALKLASMSASVFSGGIIDNHEGAPESEKRGAGKPVPVTPKLTVPVLDRTDNEPAGVICGAVGPWTKSSCTKPSPGAAAGPKLGT